MILFHGRGEFHCKNVPNPTKNNMKKFLDKYFFLDSNSAERLYFDYAEEMPIIDYHCHLPPDQIAADLNFDNITQVWLNGDHYKWRAMRANGVYEKYITGSATDKEKFLHPND